jgi:hypothetical protein
LVEQPFARPSGFRKSNSRGDRSNYGASALVLAGRRRDEAGFTASNDNGGLYARRFIARFFKLQKLAERRPP